MQLQDRGPPARSPVANVMAGTQARTGPHPVVQRVATLPGPGNSIVSRQHLGHVEQSPRNTIQSDLTAPTGPPAARAGGTIKSPNPAARVDCGASYGVVFPRLPPHPLLNGVSPFHHPPASTGESHHWRPGHPATHGRHCILEVWTQPPQSPPGQGSVSRPSPRR